MEHKKAPCSKALNYSKIRKRDIQSMIGRVAVTSFKLGSEVALILVPAENLNVNKLCRLDIIQTNQQLHVKFMY